VVSWCYPANLGADTRLSGILDGHAPENNPRSRRAKLAVKGPASPETSAFTPGTVFTTLYLNEKRAPHVDFPVRGATTRRIPMNDAMEVAGATPKVHEIELTLNSFAELFDASAPTCLGGQPLHNAIADYLAEQINAAPAGCPVKLILHVPAAEASRASQIAAAIRAYFQGCYADEQRSMRRIFRDGELTLMIGLVFLIFVNGLGGAIRATFSRPFTDGVANGLEIFGWVAMWRPAELLLYDWIPVRRKRNLMARLSGMEVECRPIESAD
jgi:hypothetical protein